MELFKKPLKTGTDEQIDKINNINKKLEQNTQYTSFKELPAELKAKGWILNKSEILIPYNDDNIYWSCRVNPESKNDKRMKKWIISWKYYTENETYSIGEEFYSNIFINRTNPQSDKEIGNRNKVMGRITQEHGLPRGQGEVRGYWDSQVFDLNKHQIGQISLDNFEKQEDIEEIKEKPQYPETFEDYPEPVQKEAIEIIQDNDFLEYLLDSVSWKHQGDRKTAKLLLLSVATAYLELPVHIYLNAPKGEGKTDLLNRIKELQPDQYVVDLVSFSSKALFYGNESILNPEFNLLFLDDIKLTIDIIELLKLLLDNERKNKIHRTVIDGKYVEMELPEQFLGLINRAKDDLDSELGDRCYYENLDNLEKKDVIYVKNAIKEKTVRIIDPYHEQLNSKIKCCIQWLVDKRIKVYNPMLSFVDVKNHNNRNITHYNSLSKGMTFWNYSKRETIDNITIGSYEDIKKTLDMISSEFQAQKDKLNDLEKKVIKELQKNPENNTNRKLGEVFEITPERIGQIIRGRDNQIGLEIKGYVQSELVNRGSYSRNEYILTEKGLDYGLNPDLIPQTPQTFICLLEKKPLLLKTKIIIDYLTYKQVVVNKYGRNKVHTFLEKNSYDLKTYDNLCLMLKDVTEYIKNDKKIIYLNSECYIKNSEHIYHKNFTKKISNDTNIYLSQFRGSEFVTSKNHNNTLNQKQRENTPQTEKVLGCSGYEISNKDLRKFIHKLIFENSQIKGIRQKTQLINSIAQIHEDKEQHFNFIKKELKYLENQGYVDIDKLEITVDVSFLDYYNSKLKDLKGDLS